MFIKTLIARNDILRIVSTKLVYAGIFSFYYLLIPIYWLIRHYTGMLKTSLRDVAFPCAVKGK